MQQVYNAVKIQLKKSWESLHGACARLTTATSNSKRLHFKAEKFENELAVARADAALQTSPSKASLEQLDVKDP